MASSSSAMVVRPSSNVSNSRAGNSRESARPVRLPGRIRWSVRLCPRPACLVTAALQGLEHRHEGGAQRMAATHSPMPSALGVSVAAANTRKWGDTTLWNRQGMHGEPPRVWSPVVDHQTPCMF